MSQSQELAAFLKTHEEHHVLVRPVALSYLVVGSLVLNTLVWSASPLLPYDAPYTLYVILLGLMVYTWFVSHMWLSYSDSSENALRELKKFRLADAKCLCCSLNHMTPKGQKILTCDRELISTCVEQWFGSVEEFEKSVQNHVLRALSRGLGGIFIPYPLMLLQVLPFTLTNMDFTAARLRGQAYSDGASSAMICVFGTLVCTPMGYAVLYLAIQYTRGCRRMLRTLLVCVMFGLQQLFVQLSLQMCVDFAGQLTGKSLWAGMQFVPTLLLWWWALRVGRREVMRA